MKTTSTSICNGASAAVALIPGFLRQLTARGFRMANSSEELLDLFEEQYGAQQRTFGTGYEVSSPSSSRAWH